MSVWYGLRLPHLYCGNEQPGAVVPFVPSALIVATGRAHLEPFLRARPIGKGACVVAAVQTGDHSDGRETWGHSLIVDPWGEAIASPGGEAPGLWVGDPDPEAVEKARRQIRSLTHGRPNDAPHGGTV